MQKFAHGNSLSNTETTFHSVNQASESACKVAIKWSYENKMIVNFETFQAIVIDSRKSNSTEG